MLRLIFSLAITIALAGCASITPSFYKLNVRQGNVVNKKELAQIHVGMSKRQVKAVLGSPLIEDPFNPSRWDYVYTFYPSGDIGDGVEHRLTLFFNGDSVSRVAGDLAAKTGQALAQGSSKSQPLAEPQNKSAGSHTGASAKTKSLNGVQRSAESSLATNADSSLN